MNKLKSNQIFCTATFLLLVTSPIQVNAETAPSQTSREQALPDRNTEVASAKERLVMMPLRLSAELQNLQGSMETALVNGLQEKYIVFAGEQVATKARQIFKKESTSTIKECDETRCMQFIAASFQSELLAVANITKQEGNYFISLTVQNIFDNKVEFSKSVTCRSCDAPQLISTLSDLLNAKKTVASDDVTDWLEARDTNTEEGYKTYVNRHPDGKYAAQAGDRIWGIIEERESKKSIDNETVSEYQNFIQNCPNSKFIELAKTRLAEAQIKLTPRKPAGIYLGAIHGRPDEVTGVERINPSNSMLIGYNISDTYSIELNYTKFYLNARASAMASTIIPGMSGSFDLHAYSLMGQYAYKLTENFRLLGAAGAHRSTYLLDSGVGYLRDEKSISWVLGLKADYSLNKTFSLRVGVDMYNMGGVVNDRIKNVGAGLLIKF